MESGGVGELVEMCIEAASASPETVEKWRRQRRTLERLPAQLADALLRRLIHRRLLYPSLLELFQHSVEEIDLKGASYVDAEWMAYLGAFRYLRSLNLADCRAINNSALWLVTGMTSLKELDLSRCSKITDAGLKHVLSIKNLEKLCISETGLTADGVMLLSSLSNLCLLDIGGIPVTDKALSSLQVLTRLEHLDLWGSKISNNGAAVLKTFPRLSFLNLAWTNVTRLPNLPSLTCLNMSSCTIRSIFDGDCKASAPLSKLLLPGAIIDDIDKAFRGVEVNHMAFLDLSGSSICNFHFLVKMKRLKHLDLSFSRMSDTLIEQVADVGVNLRYLNLSNTKLTTQGVCILAGNVMNLESLSLSHTAIDDTALAYIGMMPSLRMLDLSATNIKGFVYWQRDDLEKIFSLSMLQNLSHLESLNLEETKVRDEAIYPLGFLRGLNCLYLKSDFLSDISLHALASLSNLKFLGFRGAVLTNSGLLLYMPPLTLRVLDLKGCWLLTEDIVSSFCRTHPHIEVRHESVQMIYTNENVSAGSSPFHRTTQAPKLKSKGGKLSQAPSGFPEVAFADERIKYTREELLELQLLPLSSFALCDPDVLPKVLRKE
ncbi:putative adenylate cyclase regulatory protein isoform X1 [Phoenix dactylifera]|uniref:Adenylate cyclase regulatory protein isoform X1 n=2 Tax=Phoenix dactylifera TaxID=42345 RepID=A0A8B7BRF4_PHODC|nr:putative adenylate cyclase regulatory protein isoform X1 [Phoenix dactylifera]